MKTEDELIAPEEEATPGEGEETKVEPTTTVVERELTDDDRMAIARQIAESNPEALTPYLPKPAEPVAKPDPTDHFADITDDLGYVDPKKLAMAQKAQAAETQAAILQGVQNMMTPVMQEFAAQRASAGLPEEVREHAVEVANELGVSLYQASQDTKTMQFVKDAAYGRAYRAGKLKLPDVESPEPVGGRSSSVLTDAQRANLADLVRIRGSAVSSKEVEDLKRSGALG